MEEKWPRGHRNRRCFRVRKRVQFYVVGAMSRDVDRFWPAPAFDRSAGSAPRTVTSKGRPP
jgi:hypothetical protein